MGKKEENWGMGAAQIKLTYWRNQHEITLSRRAEKLSSPYSSLQKRLCLRTQYLCAFLAMSPTFTVQSQRDTLGSSLLTFRDPAPIPPHLGINITWLPCSQPSFLSASTTLGTCFSEHSARIHVLAFVQTWLLHKTEPLWRLTFMPQRVEWNFNRSIIIRV